MRNPISIGLASFIGLLALAGIAPASAETGGAMSLVPREASIVGGIDVAKVRANGTYKKYVTDDLRKKLLSQGGSAELIDGTRTLTIAAHQKKVIAVLKGAYQPARLIALVNAGRAKDNKAAFRAVAHNGATLYMAGEEPDSAIAFLGSDTMVGGTLAWVKKAVDLSKGQGASVHKNGALMALVKRARTSETLWGAGIVPADLQKRASASGATINTVVLSVDLGSGLALSSLLGTASAAEATRLTEMANEQMAALRGNPAVALGGFGGFLDAVQVKNDGATVVAAVNLTQPQFDDLVTRVQAMFASYVNAARNTARPKPPRPPSDEATPLAPR